MHRASPGTAGAPAPGVEDFGPSRESGERHRRSGPGHHRPPESQPRPTATPRDRGVHRPPSTGRASAALESRNVVCWPGAWTPASKREVRPSQSAARRSAAHFVTVTKYRLAEIFGAPRQRVSGDANIPISCTTAGPNRLSRNRFRRANTVIEPARSKRPLAGADQSQAPAN